MAISGARILALFFSVPEQRRKPLLAVAAEIDDAAARRGVTRGPFQFGEAVHDRRSQRAREMMAPLAPVEAGLADRAARMGECLRLDLQALRQESLAFGGELHRLLALADQFLPLHAVEHLHAEIAGEVVVADPRPP